MKEEGCRWLDWARELQAMAQVSLHYARNEFERARAERLREIAVEIVTTYSDVSPEEAHMAFSAQPGYVTPKVDVRAAVFKQEKILMVREALDGGWTLPGGWADVGESPHLSVEREVLEEAGLNVRVKSLVGVYDANRIEGSLSLFHAYKLVFLCEPTSGDLATSAETTEVGFFPIDDLPQPFSPHRTKRRYIDDAVAVYRDPNRPTVFD
jgi:ADP-ribose pyrophosphatase YjhB (NUDIX family)